MHPVRICACSCVTNVCCCEVSSATWRASREKASTSELHDKLDCVGEGFVVGEAVTTGVVVGDVVGVREVGEAVTTVVVVGDMVGARDGVGEAVGEAVNTPVGALGAS